MAANRRGMTLLELILALSLSVVIMLALGMIINLHMKTLQTRRTHVEEGQLARQVLRRVADDLRSAVQYQVIDFSSVEKLASGGAAGMAGSALESAGVPADVTGLDASLLEGLVDPAAEEEPAAISATAAPPAIPGLYGNQYELQIDVSRLPRIDEYQVMLNPLSGESVADVPSDVKTVAYYLQPDSLATATTSTLNDPTTSERVRATGAVGRGLVRRELDRAVSLWAAENNNLEDLTTQGEMLAMEVTGLEFRYYDGTEWLTEWNSEERQGLPVAVAIAVEIGGDADSSADDASGGSLLEPTIAAVATPGEPSSAATDRLLYRLVVHLPASEPTSADSARFPATTETEDPAGVTMPADAQNADSGDNGQGQDQGQGGNGQNQGGGQGQGGQGGGGQGQGGRGGEGPGSSGGQQGPGGGGQGGGGRGTGGRAGGQNSGGGQAGGQQSQGGGQRRGGGR